MVSSVDSRLNFANAKRALIKAKVPVDKAILSQSFMQFETLLNPNQTNFSFNIQVNQGTQYITEQRLNLQDSFFVSQINVMLRVVSTSTSNTTYQNYLMSYPSAIFDGMWNCFGMYGFYAGHLSLTVNNRVLCPAWDIMRHLHVPETQAPDWTGPAPVSTFYNLLDELDGANDGFYPVEPNWVLIGSKNNELVLNLPANLGANLNSNAQVRAVVIMRGVLAQNSTVVH